MNIVLSKKDTVGLNVSKLTSLRYIEFENILEFNEVSELNLFISKHESASKLKCFSCHSTGNFSKADYGGQDYTLSISNALVQSACLLKLKELLKPLKLEKLAVLEATHHGPSINSPCLFLEVGSTEEEYNNKIYCKILEETANYLKNNYSKIMQNKTVSAIGIGGGHYSYEFTKLISKNLCIGHICPEYQLKNLDFEMFKQMIQKTIPAPSLVLINKKVNKEIFVNYCQKLNIDFRVI
ncbi:MAG: D-aminoacyl-tRNA deacylase [Candidatus Nanoarchaeia archaeon]|nr:D-aminoacyl-tRNA deacylase [Candidatus Nanoarchaeia archaeon]